MSHCNCMHAVLRAQLSLHYMRVKAYVLLLYSYDIYAINEGMH
jgi:hypothetical protein